MDYPKIKIFELKALKEIGNIGAGHAATSWAGMINKKVMIDVCNVDLVNIRDLAETLKHEYGDVLGVQLGFSGDINGSIYYLMSKQGALDLVDMLRGRPHGGDKELDGPDLTAFKECGGVLLSSYLRAISDLLKLSLIIAVPDCVHRVDFVSKLLSGQHTADEGVFCTQTAFIEGKNRIKVCFCLILDNRGLGLILKRV